jgi:hypothetical protein
MVLAVLALALFGRGLEATTDLVRLLRTPPPVVIADGGVVDAARLGPMDLADASPSPLLAATPAADVRTRAALPNQNLDPNEIARTEVAPGAPALDASTDHGDGAKPASAAAGQVRGDAGADAAQALSREAIVATRAEPVEKREPVRCGWRICPEGQQCCNWSCSVCVSPGETCSRALCGLPTLPVSAPCGPSTCNVSEVCCNASCGICVPPGGTCSKEPCPGMYVPVSPTCGMNTCNVGQVCCNPSCGTCANPGETCSLEPCS